MACRKPIAIQTPAGHVFVACKQCLPCRIAKQSSLALRTLLEYRVSCFSMFLTLTYRDEECPENLCYRDFSDFLKRLRYYNQKKENPISIRYLACGEYGEQSGRPHFHAIILNSLIPSKKDWITTLWPSGFYFIGQVTPASINYTARYCLKVGPRADESLAHWSRRPALGSVGMRAIAKYMRDRGDILTEPPVKFRIEGKNYTVDRCLQTHFWREYVGDEDAELRASSLKAVANYIATIKYGDPLADIREAKARKVEWHGRARKIGKL